MKYQKILGLVATAGLLLAGCATDSDNSNTWLSDPNAGTDGTVSSRTLIVTDEAAYNSLKSKYYLPTKWQIGNCTVLDKDGNAITE